MQIKVNGTIAKKHILFSESIIQNRVKEIAKQINADYGQEHTLVILIVLHGAIIFAADLIRHLSMPSEIETVRIKSYVGTKSTGTIEFIHPLPPDIGGKHVLIVEDIVDTGRSLAFLMKELNAAKVSSIKVCSFLDKPSAHEFTTKVDYVGFEIENHFVIGYGLDLDGKYRHLPYIAQLLL